MSQWGKEKVFHGAKFVPLISTRVWAQVSGERAILDIILVDDGGNNRYAKTKLADLKGKYNGKPYHNW